MNRPRDLLARQLALECIRVTAEGRMVRGAGPCPDAIPLIYVAFLGGECLRFVRADASNTVGEGVCTAPVAMLTPTGLRRLSGDSAGKTWGGRSCYFERIPELAGNHKVEEIDGEFVIRREGVIVCRAWSSREDQQAAELAVETQPGYRRRGFARTAATAWALRTRQRGKVAFYSYRTKNIASRALAESLGVICFCEVVVHD